MGTRRHRAKRTAGGRVPPPLGLCLPATSQCTVAPESSSPCNSRRPSFGMKNHQCMRTSSALGAATGAARSTSLPCTQVPGSRTQAMTAAARIWHLRRAAGRCSSSPPIPAALHPGFHGTCSPPCQRTSVAATSPLPSCWSRHVAHLQSRLRPREHPQDHLPHVLAIINTSSTRQARRPGPPTSGWVQAHGSRWRAATTCSAPSHGWGGMEWLPSSEEVSQAPQKRFLHLYGFGRPTPHLSTSRLTHPLSCRWA